mgnify:FL=1
MTKKTKNQTKLYSFDIPLYPRKLWVVIGDDFKVIYDKFLRCGKSLDVPTNVFDALTLGNINDDKRDAGIIIWLPILKNVTHGIIAHESLHALDYVMYDIHEDPHDYENNNERDCYLLEWIVDTVENCVTKYKKK